MHQHRCALCTCCRTSCKNNPFWHKSISLYKCHGKACHCCEYYLVRFFYHSFSFEFPIPRLMNPPTLDSYVVSISETTFKMLFSNIASQYQSHQGEQQYGLKLIPSKQGCTIPVELLVALLVADLTTGGVNVFPCFVKEGRCHPILTDLKEP